MNVIKDYVSAEERKYLSIPPINWEVIILTLLTFVFLTYDIYLAFF